MIGVLFLAAAISSSMAVSNRLNDLMPAVRGGAPIIARAVRSTNCRSGSSTKLR